jgi:hypothetical protein
MVKNEMADIYHMRFEYAHSKLRTTFVGQYFVPETAVKGVVVLPADITKGTLASQSWRY